MNSSKHMSNFETPMAKELEIFIEGQLELVRSKQLEATPMEASELWGQMKQLQKMKTWLHWWEGQNRKR
jgi:hypothetical protein